MTVRVRYKVEVAISSTSAEEKDLGNAKFEVVVDSQVEGGTWKTALPAASTDVPLQLTGLATARFLFIRTSAANTNDTPVEITVKRNDPLNEEIPIAPLSTSKQGHLLISTSGLTALYASNAGAVDMEVIVSAAGD